MKSRFHPLHLLAGVVLTWALPISVLGASSHSLPAMSEPLEMAEGQPPVISASPWIKAGLLSPKRFLHTATLLPATGEVLVAGGYSVWPDGSWFDTDSVNLYDPVSNTWTVTFGLNIGRESHQALALLDGRVLVVGGMSDAWGGWSAITQSEIYDRATGFWTMTGSMNVARAYFAATVLEDGRVLVIGGNSNTEGGLRSTEIWDPATGVWTMGSDMNVGRSSPTATLITGGKVLVAGGFQLDPNSPVPVGELASAEVYDPSTGKWTMTSNEMSEPRIYATATPLPDGSVLVAGGENGWGDHSLSSADVYDPVANRWSATAPLATDRSRASATLLTNGQVLVAGGYSFVNNGNPHSYPKSTELYNPQTRQWSFAGNMISGRHSAAMTPVARGEALITGGSSDSEVGDGVTASTERYLGKSPM